MFENYHPTIVALATAGALLLLQLIIADMAIIRAGHRGGTPIPVDVKTFLFRSNRAHANTNESISAFIAFALAGMLLAASPAWLNGLSWAYIASRVAHMGFYYANMKIPRSSAFGVSLVVLLGMALAVAAAMLRP